MRLGADASQTPSQLFRPTFGAGGVEQVQWEDSRGLDKDGGSPTEYNRPAGEKDNRLGVLHRQLAEQGHRGRPSLTPQGRQEF